MAIMRENIKNQWYVPEVEDKILIRLSNICRVINCQVNWQRKLAIIKSWKTDVSSVSSLSEWLRTDSKKDWGEEKRVRESRLYK